jgi:hypothetical protein
VLKKFEKSEQKGKFTPISVKRPKYGQKLTFYDLTGNKLRITDSVVTDTNRATYGWRGFEIMGPEPNEISRRWVRNATNAVGSGIKYASKQFLGNFAGDAVNKAADNLAEQYDIDLNDKESNQKIVNRYQKAKNAVNLGLAFKEEQNGLVSLMGACWH